MTAEASERLPTLGRQLVGVRPESKGWMQEHLLFGPGGMSGKPYRPTLDHIAFVWSAYEVWPKGHPRAGLRRYNKAHYSRAKGTAKTELGAGLGLAELAGGPVRANGFDARGEPVGIGVLDPDIPFLATAAQQAKDLAFTRARAMAQGALADLIIDGEEELQLAYRGGRLYLVTARAKSKDGYIPTFYDADETHLYTEDGLHDLVDTCDENLAKRSTPGIPPVWIDGELLAANADPWGLHQTTAYGLGENSVAEATHKLWLQIQRGEITYPLQLLFDHLEASDHYDLEDDEQLREAIREASGAAREFRDVEYIVGRFRSAPKHRWVRRRRLWLNQVVKEAHAWLNPDDVAAVEVPRVPRRGPVTLGFDGSENNDSTILVGCQGGHLFVIDSWQRPANAPRGWMVPTDKVDRAVRKAFRDFDVVAMWCDPPGWKDYIDRWAADFGDDIVIKVDTRAERRMADMVEGLQTAFEKKRVTQSGQAVLVEQLQNARTRAIGNSTERASENPPVVLVKETDNSPFKIDGAIASVLAFAAHGKATATGKLKRIASKRRRVKFH